MEEPHLWHETGGENGRPSEPLEDGEGEVERGVNGVDSVSVAVIVRSTTSAPRDPHLGERGGIEREIARRRVRLDEPEGRYVTGTQYCQVHPFYVERE